MIHTDYVNPVQMRRSYKFLMRPTSKQVDALTGVLKIHCEVYNAALEHRKEAWNRARVPVSYEQQSRELTEVRKIRPDVAACHSQSLQQTLRRLDQTFQAFFRRVRQGDTPGYPRFRSARRFDTITFPQPPDDGGLRNNRLHVPGIGSVRVHQHRAIAGRVKQVGVKREGKRWYVFLSCDDVPAQPLPSTGAVVGIDMGVAHFLTTSYGAHVPNPKYLAVSADRLTEAQRSLERKKRGSRRRRAAVARVGAIHRKVRRQRLDHAHKVALTLVRDHDVIAHEALTIANMTKRPNPRPAGDGTYVPNGAAAKAGLNDSILDAGWGCFLSILAAKAESAGRTIIAVNPAYTSQRCAQCGHVAAGNRFTREAFKCLACGHRAHADVNAAINILRAGLARQEAQAA